MNNVNSIVNSNLCNGCCECLSACTANNITIVFSLTAGHPVPCIADKSCNDCGECLAKCSKASLLATAQLA